MSGSNAPVQAPSRRFVVYWRQADWGFFHRRNEAFTRTLAAQGSVDEVVHLETISLKGLAASAVRTLVLRNPRLRSVYRLHVRKTLARRPIRIDERLLVKSLLIVALSDRVWLKRLNRWLFDRQARRLRASKRTVLLAYPPAIYLRELRVALQPHLTLADLVDDVPAQERDPQRRAALEKAFVEILPLCAAVFATSEELVQRYGAHAPSGIEFLPNGVKPLEPPIGGEHGRTPGQRPRVGYTGTLNRTLDRSLIEYLLKHNPDVEFILIGPVEAAVGAFVQRLKARYPNCRYLGRKRHDELQWHLADCDVLVNLKRADAGTRGNDSIKLYEYLATGKPVVSTPIAPADRLRDVVYVAEDKVQFHRLLQLALAEKAPEKRRQRRRIAADNCWDRRVARILERVGRLHGSDSNQPQEVKGA
ncbi:MAG: glycosyltransferase [Nitrococcus mobilis]|nr:glycosyltransferase [Nitrococcus mobilis]